VKIQFKTLDHVLTYAKQQQEQAQAEQYMINKLSIQSLLDKYYYNQVNEKSSDSIVELPPTIEEQYQLFLWLFTVKEKQTTSYYKTAITEPFTDAGAAASQSTSTTAVEQTKSSSNNNDQESQSQQESQPQADKPKVVTNGKLEENFSPVMVALVRSLVKSNHLLALKAISFGYEMGIYGIPYDPIEAYAIHDSTKPRAPYREDTSRCFHFTHKLSMLLLTDPLLMTLVGYAYDGYFLKYRLVPVSSRLAFTWYRNAELIADFPRAIFFLAICFENGDGCEKDAKKGIEYYIKSADAGVAIAQSNLGYSYEYGDGVGKDMDRAIHYYKLASNQQYGRAINDLGMCYHYGDGLPIDYKEAVRCYNRAIELKYPPANHNMAMIHLHGRGCDKNPQLALEWFHKGSDMQHEKSMLKLIEIYETGKVEGVPINLPKLAVELRRISDIHNHAESTYKLAKMYEEGTAGLELDYATAVKLYYKAQCSDSVARADRLRKCILGLQIYANFKRGKGVVNEAEHKVKVMVFIEFQHDSERKQAQEQSS